MTFKEANFKKVKCIDCGKEDWLSDKIPNYKCEKCFKKKTIPLKE